MNRKTLDALRGIPIDMLRTQPITHLVSCSGRYLGFLTTRPQHEYGVWELQVFEPKSAEEASKLLMGEVHESTVAYKILELRKKHETFHAGRRGRFRVYTYEVPMGQEPMLWDLEFGLFISAGEMFGEEISNDPLAGVTALRPRRG